MKSSWEIRLVSKGQEAVGGHLSHDRVKPYHMEWNFPCSERENFIAYHGPNHTGPAESPSDEAISSFIPEKSRIFAIFRQCQYYWENEKEEYSMTQPVAQKSSLPRLVLPLCVTACCLATGALAITMLPRASFAATFHSFSLVAAATPAPPAPPPAATPKPVPVIPKPLISGDRLYLSRFTRYTTGDTQLTRAVGLYEAGKHAEAQKILEQNTSPQARWWYLKSCLRTGAYKEILRIVPGLAKTFFLLREDLVFWQLKAYLGQGDRENAQILARLLLKGSRRKEALVVLLKLAAGQKNRQSEEKLLRSAITGGDLTDGQKVDAILRLLTLVRTAMERRALLEQAWGLSVRRSVTRQLDALARKWFKRPMLKLASCSAIVRRGERLNRINLHKAAVTLLSRKMRCTVTDRCRRDFTLARSLFFLKRYAKAAPPAGRAVLTCEKTRLVELRVKSKYLAGKIAFSRGRYKTAVKAFGRVAREHPDHSYADDGLYRLALTWEKLKNKAAVSRTLTKISRAHPKGDRFQDALWQPILAHLEKGDWSAAGTLLKKARGLVTPTPPLENWGRLLYWQGRVAHLMGQNTRAMKHYKECIATAPLTYHALLSLNRLEQLQKGVAGTLLTTILSKNAPGTLPWSVLKDPGFATDAFARFVELARLGDDLAMGALKTLTPPLPTHPGTIARRGFFKGVAIILHLSGYHFQAYRLMGRVLMDHAHSWPTADTRVLWQMAYPSLYGTRLKAASTRAGIDPTLLMGLVREESGFSRRARSTAGALGLAQLMPRTARDVARRNRIPYTSEADLADPSTNLLIAGSYLGQLKKLFKGQRLLYVGAYNCGEGAMGKWRKADPRTPLDLFVEKLRVTETRDYIKRVLSSMFVYHVLGKHPGFPVLAL